LQQTILVIAAHPDDELLGLGGTIKRHIQDGDEVISVICAQGRKEEAHHIKQCSQKANHALGIRHVVFLEYPNLEMEIVPLHLITKKIEAFIKQFKPDIIYTHHYGDLNRDHQITFQAVMTAARPLAGQKPIDIYCFETVSSTEWSQQTNEAVFKPTVFVDITDMIDAKIEALKHYDVEMRDFPHPRSYEGVRHIASVRGMTVGKKYAEAFELIRKVW